MASIPFLSRLKTIGNLIVSQSFFVTLFVILVLTLIVLFINIKVKSKAPRYVAAIVYFGLALLVLARYGHYVLTFNDSIVEKVFKAMYFPNMVVYLSMLTISLLLMVANIVDERFSVFSKIINTVSFFLIWFLFILVIDSVKKFGLNFYEVKELYSNRTVMVLLQASMSIFVVWLSSVSIDLIVRKIADRMDNRTKTNKIDVGYSNEFNPNINMENNYSFNPNPNLNMDTSFNYNSNVNSNINTENNYSFNSNPNPNPYLNMNTSFNYNTNIIPNFNSRIDSSFKINDDRNSNLNDKKSIVSQYSSDVMSNDSQDEYL